MGFAAVSHRAKPPEMLISASIAAPDSDAATAAAKAGADLVLLESADLDSDAEKLKALTAALSIPCGLRVSKPSPGTAEAARALGVDYLLIGDHDTPAAALVDEEIGFVLAVTEDASDSFLHVVGSTPFDALYGGEISQTLTLRRQLDLRRMAALARKPLLLDARDPVTSQDLECLRDSGVAALIIEVKGRSAPRVVALRQAIAAMAPRRKARSDRDSTALLPSVSRAGEGDDEEDD